MKKFFSLVLALVMALSLTTVAFGAATEVDTADELIAWAANPTSDLEIKADIDLAGKIWAPAFVSTPDLTINGNGHTISNMTVSGDNNLGFIGTAYQNITIKDLTFKNATVTATGSFVGTVIGYGWGNANYTLNNVDVIDSNVSTSIANKGIRVGGLIGFFPLNGGELTLKDCDVIGTTVVGYHNVGGVVGTNLTQKTVTVENCTTEDNTLVYGSPNVGAFDFGASTSGYNAYVPASGLTAENNDITMPVVIGNVGYPTAAAAVAAAQDGDTIVLKIDTDEDITLPEGVALDKNGKNTGTVTAANGATLTTNTSGNIVAGTTVTSGDKFDLYLADAGMKAALAAGAESVPALSFTNMSAKNNQDGSGNLAYIAASNSEYFVKTTNPTIADYAVTVAGKTDILYYVTVVDLADVQYGATAKAFTNFGTKCGQLYRVDTTKEYYVIEKAEAGFALAKDDVSYVVNPAARASYVNVLVGNEIKTLAATRVDDSNTVLTIDEILAHNWAVTGVKATTTGKTVPTQVTCLNCGAVVTKFYDAATKVPAGTVATPVPGYEQATNTHDAWFFVEPAAASAGGTVVTPSTDKVQSAETFDAGIAMYVGMSVMAAAGSAVVIGKKKD